MFYRRAGAGALTVGVLGLTWSPSAAEAARTPVDREQRLLADHNNDGNGHHNATALSVRSPIRNRGYQHTTNRNAGGVSDAQNALCHTVRVCNLTQKVTIVNPEKPAPQPASPHAQTAPPAAAVPTAPHARTSPARPLLSIGPYGLLLADDWPATDDPMTTANTAERTPATWGFVEEWLSGRDVSSSR